MRVSDRNAKSFGDPQAIKKALESDLQRYQQVQEEMGEIGKLFEQTRISRNVSEEELRKEISEIVNVLRAPGFCAYQLAREGLALLNLISVRAALLREQDRPEYKI